MKKNKLQETNDHPPQITITNKFEVQRQAVNEGDTKHERNDPAPPPIFVPENTNMQRLKATIEQVLNRLTTLKCNQQRPNKDNNKQIGISQNYKRPSKRERS
jgi:hypothetical protein